MMNKKPKSVFRDLYNAPYTSQFSKLSRNAKDDVDFVQRLNLLKKLEIHQGCVNTICWNDTGEYLLSGSDDQHLVITNAHTYEVKTNYCTSHHANIFSAKFLPCSGDKQIVSCSGDGIILHTDLENTKATYHNQFNCHEGTTYEVITLPNDSNTFLSCGEDCTVRWFDLRTKTSCRKPHCKDDILISSQRAVTALSVNPTASHHLAVGCADSTVRIYDRRYLTTYIEGQEKAQAVCSFIAPSLEDRRYRITSLSYSADGQDILVSYSSDYLYLFKIQENKATELKKSPTKPYSRWDKIKQQATGKRERVNQSPPPVRRLRLRGDWSDTGPDARPERENTASVNIGQARPQLHATLMQRMTDVLSQMLNDPMTRAVLSAGGEDSLDPEEVLNSNNNSNNNSSNQIGAETVQTQREQQPSQSVDQSSVDQSTSSRPTTSREEQPDAIVNSPEQPAPSTAAPSTDATATKPPPEATPGQSERSDESPACVTSLYSHLTRLRNLRDGFIEQHGSEPSVSLRYSPESTANATISLRVKDELGRSSAEGAATADSSDFNTGAIETAPAPSTSEERRNGRNEEAPPPMMPDRVHVTGYADDSDDDDEDFDDDDMMMPSESMFQRSDLEMHTYDAEMKMRYVGHRNARTMIKEATFWGDDFVMSGSDCGHVFIWDKNTAELKMLLQADQHVVNCLQPHPTLPLLATSGIDHDVKLWTPTLEEPTFDCYTAQDLISRNAIMLKETRDTITVPAAFMIRMLACLNQIRRGARARTRRQEDADQA